LFRAFSNEVSQTSADMGHMKRELSFDYAVTFCEEREPAKALIDGLSWKLGLKSCATGKHEGSIPSIMSYIDVNCKTSIVSALYGGYQYEENNSRNLIRLYNPSQNTDKVTITLNKPILKASIVDFNGNVTDELNITDGSISFEVVAHKIINIAFSLN
jgi:hypothetical protein